MKTLDYTASAELYLGRDWHSASDQGARRFSSAAKAIRFALEEVAPVSLRGALMVVDGQSYAKTDLAAFYRNARYPLPRKPAMAARLREPEEEMV